MKKTGLKGFVYDFSIDHRDFNISDNSDISDI